MLNSNRFRMGALMCACLFTAALLSAAVAQPPSPGGAPAPGGPGGGPGAGPGAGPGGPGPGPGGPGGAPAPSPTFSLSMCNKTSDQKVIFVATISLVGKDQFRAQGWAQVPQGQCVQVGSFQRPAVWFHGRSPSGTFWAGKPEADICVNLNGGFDYTWGGAQKNCGQGEVPAPFQKIDIEPQFNSFTMTLN
jgi:uncharacterized membrane protein